MAITFKREQTMMGDKAFAVHRDGQLIGWAYFSPVTGWRCVSNGRRTHLLLADEGRGIGGSTG